MAEYIDKAQVQTELMMNAERYTIAHESRGFGIVEWSDNLIPVSKAMEIIRNMPSIEDVPVVHGRWIIRDNPGTGWYRITCSECGEDVTATAPCIGFFPNAKVSWDYCPACGARMDAEEKTNAVKP